MASTAHATAWTCPACGQVNLAGVTCDRCGVAKRMLDDPPLDIPYRPPLTRLPAFWLALVWAAAALAQAGIWLSPAGRGLFGDVFLLAGTLASGAAAGSSLFTALWQRVFNEVTLVVPDHAKTGEKFTAEVRIVPYETVTNVSVKVRLVDQYYKTTENGVETARRELGKAPLLAGARLPGRRLTNVTADFVAPFPDTPHESIAADIRADVLGLLAFVVPALQWQARNLREHGGYFVEARVRVGFLSRKYHKRVVAYYLGSSVHVG